MLYCPLSGLGINNYLADNSMQSVNSIAKNASIIMFYPNFIISAIKRFKDYGKWFVFVQHLLSASKRSLCVRCVSFTGMLCTKKRICILYMETLSYPWPIGY